MTNTVQGERERWWREMGRIAILYRVDREDFGEKLTLEQKPEGEGASHADV